MSHHPTIFPFFFFNDTATTEIYTLSLHDALPIFLPQCHHGIHATGPPRRNEASQQRSRDQQRDHHRKAQDRKSTRLNSSHMSISYAVFCLKKKKKQPTNQTH